MSIEKLNQPDLGHDIIFPYKLFSIATHHHFSLFSTFCPFCRYKRTTTDIGAEVRTSAEKQKASEIKKHFKCWRSLQDNGFLVNLGIAIFLTLVFYYLIISVATRSLSLNLTLLLILVQSKNLTLKVPIMAPRQESKQP